MIKIIMSNGILPHVGRLLNGFHEILKVDSRLSSCFLKLEFKLLPSPAVWLMELAELCLVQQMFIATIRDGNQGLIAL